MESQIRDSDFVILICTPLYAEKSNIPRGGVGYEKNIISAEMLQASDLRPKFIPIMGKGTFENALPTYLGSKYAIDFRQDQNHSSALDELLRAIYKQPHPDKPPLGQNPFDNTNSITTISPSLQTEPSIVKRVIIPTRPRHSRVSKRSIGPFRVSLYEQTEQRKGRSF